jgi:DnaJ homologue, subfamily C, member 28, conserved domain
MERPQYESPVERAIREAQERGEFDDLPGAGRPLPMRDTDDPMWWVRQLAEREQLDFTGALPPAVALRKEAATFPEALVELRSEESVRAVLEDFNRRVRRDRLRPPDPGMPQLLAPTVDVEVMIGRWRALRAASQPPEVDPPVTSGEARPRRRWWRRGRGTRES